MGDRHDSLASQLVHTSVRIETTGPKGESRGSGFFFNFRADNIIVPCIVTNRHVVDGEHSAAVHVTHADAAGKPVAGSHSRVSLPLKTGATWVGHPDPACDLAIIPVLPIYRTLEQSGTRVYHKAFGVEHFPKPEDHFGPIEEVHMVGYPTGLWDKVNNRPIVRRGITATDPTMDYDGEPLFVVDMACFPGSSGSAVVIYNDGMYTQGSNILSGTRLRLLGILFAGPQYTVAGKIEVVNAPTALVPLARTQIPTNLGFVIHARRLLEFDSVVRAMLVASKP